MGNKQAVFAALSSFLRANNFEGKRLFIEKEGGLQFLHAILKEESTPRRLQKKVLFLLHDIVNTSADTFPSSPNFVRGVLASQPEFTGRLIDILVAASLDLQDAQGWDIRENIIRILAKLILVNPEILTKHNQVLTMQKLKLAKEVQTCDPDKRDLFL